MKRMMKRWGASLLAVAVAAGTFTAGGFPVLADVGGTRAGNLADNGTAAPQAWGATPSPNQYDYQKEELAAFCHFGPNTFEGVEWGEHYGDRHPSEIFRLQHDFDADSMVRAFQEAGFKKLIVTAKHHDGFCIWASDYTDYDVAEAGYQEGEGDVLADISAACTKYDMNMGLYLSPWDVHEPSYGYFDKDGNSLCGSDGQPKDGMTWEQVEALDELDYNEYYNNQLDEILGDDKYGNDGHFVEVWMDGAKGSGSSAQNYDFNRWFHTIQKHEGIQAGYPDDCLLFGAEAYTTVRWIGNESGIANEETWSKSKTNKENNTIDSNMTNGTTKGFFDGNQWTVPEADARITSGWFWGNSKKTPKSLDELADMYFNSVGHNATLLLNVPPNTEGKIDQEILERVAEFGQNVKDSFKNNLAKEAEVTASAVRGNDIAFAPENILDGDDATYWTMDDGVTTGSLTLDLGETKTFDLVTIEEAIQLGQRISGFSVEYQNGDGGEWKKFAEGTTIGAKRICRNRPVKASRIRIQITGSYAVPLISEVGVYKATEDFALGQAIPDGLDMISVADTDISDGKGFTVSQGWTVETAENAQAGSVFLGGTSMWAHAGKEATLTFTGSKVWLYGTKDSGHGTADIYIDGSKVDSIDTRANNRSTGQMIYESPDLNDGSHTLRLVNTGTIGLDAAVVLDNDGIGMLQFESNALAMEEDAQAEITVKRIGGSSGEVTIDYTNNPGSAWQGHYDADLHGTLTFGDGETEKTFTVTTKRFTEVTGDLFFTVDLENAGGGVVLGFIPSMKITIRDLDDPSRMQEAKDLLQECQALDFSLYVGEEVESVKDLMKSLEEYLTQEDQAPRKELFALAAQLKTLKENLKLRENYSAEDPFVMPVGKEIKTLEAELFTLDASGATDSNKYVRITDNEQASNKKEVNWFEEGNRIILPFVAEKAGVYQMTATYRSGRAAGNPNAFEWSGTNVASGSQDVHNNGDASTFCTVALNIEVTKAGAGELVFTASRKAGPVIDKFVIEYQDQSEDTVAVTGVRLEPDALLLTTDHISDILSPVIEPSNATNQNVTYQSSDADVAEVDESGLVTGKKSGTARITVTTEDGGKTASCTVTVELAEEPIRVTGVALDKAAITLTNENRTERLTASVEPSNATNQNVTYQSSDADVAEVDESGLVTGKKNGTARITVTTEDGGKTASCTITVSFSDSAAIQQQEALQKLDTAVLAAAATVQVGQGNYTKESWEAFLDAYQKAANRSGKETAEELNRLLGNLQRAQSALELVQQPNTQVTALSAPTGVKVSSTAKGVKVTFQAVANASSYEIYRQSGTAAAKKIAVTAKTSYVDAKAPGGKKVTYTVVAVSSNAAYSNSAASAGAGVKLLKAVTGLKAKAKTGGVSIRFKTVKGAKSYIIYRASKKDGVYKKIKTLSAKKQTYFDKKAKKGKNYYKVIAKKGKIYSSAGKIASVSVKK